MLSKGIQSKKTQNPSVRTTSLQRPKLHSPMVSIIEGFHCTAERFTIIQQLNFLRMKGQDAADRAVR